MTHQERAEMRRTPTEQMRPDEKPSVRVREYVRILPNRRDRRSAARDMARQINRARKQGGE